MKGLRVQGVLFRFYGLFRVRGLGCRVVIKDHDAPTECGAVG